MNAIHGADLPFDEFLEQAKDLIIQKRSEYSLMTLGSLLLPFVSKAAYYSDLFESIQEEILS